MLFSKRQSEDDMKKQRKSVLIIGAGMGGLSTGCYAQMNGYDTQILEMHEFPGGCCTSWERPHFTCDQCISWLLGSSHGTMNQIWTELGGLDGKKIQHFDVFNRVYGIDGEYVDFFSDPDRLERHLLEISPEDEDLIKDFCDGTREFMNLTDSHPFLKPVSLMSLREKFKMFWPYLKRFSLVGKAHSTLMYDFAERFKHPLLREAFLYIFYERQPSFPLLPFYFNLACAAQKNAGVPEGGSMGLATSIAARYEQLGGNIHYNSRVEKILTENDRAIGVRLSDGVEMFSDVVVSACDGFAVTAGMLDERYTESNPMVAKLYKELMNEKEMTFPSYFTLFLGVNADYTDHCQTSTYVLEDELAEQLPGMLHPSINVQIRNVHYPHIAAEGTTLLFVTFFCEYQPWKDICDVEGGPEYSTWHVSDRLHTKRRRPFAYRKAKKQAASVLIDFLADKFPGLKENLIMKDIATPLTQLRYTGNRNGTVLAWQPFLASGEIIEKLVHKTNHGLVGLENFYMAGHWTTTGGLIRAASTGRHVVQYMCKDDSKAFETYIPSSEPSSAEEQPRASMPDVRHVPEREPALAPRS